MSKTKLTELSPHIMDVTNAAKSPLKLGIAKHVNRSAIVPKSARSRGGKMGTRKNVKYCSSDNLELFFLFSH